MASAVRNWQRSSFCGSNACVEVALDRETVEIRDGKNPELDSLRLTWTQWNALVSGIKDGQFDRP